MGKECQPVAAAVQVLLSGQQHLLTAVLTTDIQQHIVIQKGKMNGDDDD